MREKIKEKLMEGRTKKILAAVLCLALVSAIAIPTLAADTDDEAGGNGGGSGSVPEGSSKVSTDEGVGGGAAAIQNGSGTGESSTEVPYYYDEAFYATLDYYGGILESSVVKSYYMNGNSAITDYGNYSKIENLTDDKTAVQKDGSVSFSWAKDEAPANFYFEGYTEKPLEEFPWTLSLKYKINGIERPAEDIAGEKGVVEIDFDAVPNDAATDYMKNNLVLAATSVFNADDILSLEAEGAQIQMLGNQRAVVFMVLPGEEQHYVMRVGSESFEYSGMILAAFPATLKQLEMIDDIKDAKDEIEDSYDAMQDSMDVILNTLDGMSGSLRATADGLDKLDTARETINGGTDDVYRSMDGMIEGLSGMDEALKPLSGHLDKASEAIAETKESMDDLSEVSAKLREQLEDVQDLLWDLQLDARSLGKSSSNGSLKRLSTYMGNLRSSLNVMKSDVDELEEIQKIETGQYKDKVDADGYKLKDDGSGDVDTDPYGVKTKGTQYTGKELYTLIDGYAKASTAWEGYENLLAGYPSYRSVAGGSDSLETFKKYLAYSGAEETIKTQVRAGILASTAGTSAISAAEASGMTTEAATAYVTSLINDPTHALGKAFVQTVEEKEGDLYNLYKLYDTSKDSEKMEALEELAALEPILDNISGEASNPENGNTANMLNAINSGIDDMNKTSGTLKKSSTDVISKTERVLYALEEVTDDLAKMMRDVDDGMESIDDTIGSIKKILKQIEELIGILDKYEPELQDSIEDMKTLSDSTSKLIGNTNNLLSTTENFLKDSQGDLNDGTHESLNGLSEALRRSTVGLDQTYILRNSKNTIDSLIRDKWDEHTGEDTRLLYMDAEAEAQSLTSELNQAPSSIQFMMRTKEIKIDEESAEKAAAAATEKVGVIGKLKELFSGIFSRIAGLFGR